jgi:hypothetical protein
VKAALTIAKREIVTYFVSPVAYVVSTVWLVWCGLQFWLLTGVFASSPSLSASIESALNDSRSLIVVCSPHAARSRWVDREIARYRELNNDGAVLALLTAGEPADGFPPSLTAGGIEPLAADVRAVERGTRRKALLRLVAGILGISFDDLARRDDARRRRQSLVATAGMLCGIAAMVLGYVALADGGIGVPRARAIRSALDARELSLFRRAPSVETIARGASSLRATLLGWLDDAGRASKFRWAFTSSAGRDDWTSAAASAAIFAGPGATPPERADFLRNIDLQFTPADLVRTPAGGPYGWRELDSVTTSAMPTIWTALAIEGALANGRLTSLQRRRLNQQLATTQQAMSRFGPRIGGYFTQGARQLGSGYNSYATALAYVALLEARRQRIPWNGSVANREAAIRGIRAFFGRNFGNALDKAGWLPDASDDVVGRQFEGLDCQIVAALLEDERMGGGAVPAAIRAHIPAMLEALRARNFDVNYGTARMKYQALDQRGRSVAESQFLQFQWYGFAVAMAGDWLGILENERHARKEDIVEARRVLGHLILDDGPEMLTSVTARHTIWANSEVAFGLASVPGT